MNPKFSEEAVIAHLAEYHAYREELVEYYDSRGAQRVNADQDIHSVFETIEALIVNPLPTCRADDEQNVTADNSYVVDEECESTP